MTHVLLTGAAGGIGTATARRLAERGHTVHAGVRSPAPHLAGVAGVRTLRLDVADSESLAAAVAEVAEHCDGLGAIVNNAGVIVQGPLELIPPAELRRQFEVNVYGPVQVLSAFLPLLRAGQGRVINVSAPTARIAVPFAGPISASKAALESLSDAMRGELAKWRIPVSVIVPGGVDTPIFEKADRATAAALSEASDDQRALYEAALAAVGKAAAKMKLAPVDGVADAIAEAVGARKPKQRYVVGGDARAFMVLARLPKRARDRLVFRQLGLKGV